MLIWCVFLGIVQFYLYAIEDRKSRNTFRNQFCGIGIIHLSLDIECTTSSTGTNIVLQSTIRQFSSSHREIYQLCSNENGLCLQSKFLVHSLRFHHISFLDRSSRFSCRSYRHCCTKFLSFNNGSKRRCHL